jgi:hypothetical protein
MPQGTDNMKHNMVYELVTARNFKRINVTIAVSDKRYGSYGPLYECSSSAVKYTTDQYLEVNPNLWFINL